MRALCVVTAWPCTTCKCEKYKGEFDPYDPGLVSSSTRALSWARVSASGNFSVGHDRWRLPPMHACAGMCGLWEAFSKWTPPASESKQYM